MKRMLGISLFVVLAAGWIGTAGAAPGGIEQRLAQLKTYDVTDSRVDSIKGKDRDVLFHLIQASMVMDAIYRNQIHPMNALWLANLQDNGRYDPRWNRYISYFQVAFSPYDIFSGDWYFPASFADAGWKELPGKNFYPVVVNAEGSRGNLDKEELNAWLRKNPLDEKAFKSPYTMIRKDDKGNLTAIPYSTYYRDWLEDAANHLVEASKLTKDANLKKLLLSRAEAFRNNTYNETEADWIAAHDTDIQLTIGPYEEYEDGIWGVKRGFGARVALKDPKATAALQSYLKLLEDFQKNLPLYEKYREDTRKSSFITAVNEIYMAGEARHGVQTLAHKLPNDRALEMTIGSRRVLFMNVLKGKCEAILKPIAEIVIAKDQLKYVSCDSFEKSTLHHELAHALGPAFYRDEKGNKKEFNEVLESINEPLEEAKADITGMYDRQYMFEKKIETSPDAEQEMYATFLAGFFRTARFGAGSAHKQGVMLQFNMLRDKGAVLFDSDGKARFDLEKMRANIRDVVQKVIELQLSGDRVLVERTLSESGKIPVEMQKLLDQVAKAGIPRDLYPRFPGVQKILNSVTLK